MLSLQLPNIAEKCHLILCRYETFYRTTCLLTVDRNPSPSNEWQRIKGNISQIWPQIHLIQSFACNPYLMGYFLATDGMWFSLPPFWHLQEESPSLSQILHEWWFPLSMHWFCRTAWVESHATVIMSVWRSAWWWNSWGRQELTVEGPRGNSWLCWWLQFCQKTLGCLCRTRCVNTDRLQLLHHHIYMPELWFLAFSVASIPHQRLLTETCCLNLIWFYLTAWLLTVILSNETCLPNVHWGFPARMTDPEQYFWKVCWICSCLYQLWLFCELCVPAVVLDSQSRKQNEHHPCFLVHVQESNTLWFSPGTLEDVNSFYLVGVALGLAVYHKVVLDLPFPLPLYRKLLGQPCGLKDLEDLDPMLARSLQALLDHDPSKCSCRVYV